MKGSLSLFKKKPGNSESARMLEELSAICDKWLKDSKAFVENKDMSLSPAVQEEVYALVQITGRLEELLPADEQISAILERLKMALGEGSAEIMFIQNEIDMEGAMKRLPLWPLKARERIDLLRDLVSKG